MSAITRVAVFFGFQVKEHGIDHLKGGDVALVDGRREQDGLQAADPKLVGREKACIRKVESESGGVSGRDVTHLIGHHHDPVLFQNHPAVRHGAYYRFEFSSRRLRDYRYVDSPKARLMALPVVAIVGRPNVGKSALFN